MELKSKKNKIKIKKQMVMRRISSDGLVTIAASLCLSATVFTLDEPTVVK